MTRPGALRCLAFVLAGFLTPLIGLAADDAPNLIDNPAVNPRWVPPGDGYDWIQLTSGEWLKGEIVALYNKKMEFDSKKLKVLSLDWDDIAQIRTKRHHQVLVDGERPVIGSLTMDDGELVVRGATETAIDRNQVVSIAAGDPKEINYWRAKVTFGLNLRGGNSSQIDYSSKASIQRRTARTRYVFDYLGSLSRIDDLETANNQRINTYFDYFYSTRFFVRPISLEYFRDIYQNIENRFTYTASLGYTIMDSNPTEWDVSIGPGYQVINYSTVEPGSPSTRKTFTGTITTNFKTELTSWVDLISQLSFQLGQQDSGGLTTHFITTFETELTSSLDFDVSFIWDRVQNPVPEENGTVPQKNDYRITVGIGLDL